MSDNVKVSIVGAIATVIAALISSGVAFSVAESRAEKEVSENINDKLPVGTVVGFYGKNPPEGWLICDGELVTSIHPALQKFLMDNFGKTRLPDLRGKTLIGVGMGSLSIDGKTVPLTTREIGQVVGEESHILKVEEIPDHKHLTDLRHNARMSNFGVVVERYNPGAVDLEDAFRHLSELNPGFVVEPPQGRPTHTNFSTTSVQVSDGRRNLSHNNMQPSLAINYIIRAK